jgi:outer membrane receptor for ferric coprogen and ferric-rhodotorulic acid
MDIYAFDRHQYPDPREALTPWSWADTTVQLDQHGVYSSMRVHFGEAWTATVGARATTARITRDIYSEDDIFGVFEYFAREEESDVVTPLVGLMYAFNDGLSWYASYARTYLHEDDRVFPINETGFGTIKGTNIETGLKGRWRDGALTGSLVAYSVRQPGWGVLDFDVLAYVRRMRQSHGVDLELQGESDSGWRFGGGYTWNVNEDETGEPMSRATPRNLLKLWADRNLAGALERWMVGGSLHAQSALTDSNAIICPVGFRDFCDLVTAKQPSYAILDLRGSYDLDAHWKLALGVNNVFDKVYYQTFNPPGTWFRGWYGEPRNFTVRVDARF